MPGVPSNRGCDQCRKQKKKCIAASPPCARCNRLCLPCIGLGKQRYKFIDSQLAALPRTPEQPTRGPSNDFTRFVSAYASLIDPTVDIKVNIQFAFGGFLAEVPRRLGFHKALDSASEAFVEAVSSFRGGHVTGYARVLRKHVVALSALRSCLDDSTTARASETLCAIQLIMIYQVFLGNNASSGHSAGIAQILRSQRFSGPKNAFEAEILAAQRGSVVVEALFSDKVYLNEREWIDLVESKLYSTTLDGRTVQFLARFPSIMQRGKKALRARHSNPIELAEVTMEVQELRDGFQPLIAQSRAQLHENDLGTLFNAGLPADKVALIHWFKSRSYGFSLAAGIISNCVLKGLHASAQEHDEQLMLFAREISTIARMVMRYRPLGTLYMVLCLSLAYIATDDLFIRADVEDLLRQYGMDCPGTLTRTFTRLEWLEQRFMMKENGLYEEPIVQA